MTLVYTAILVVMASGAAIGIAISLYAWTTRLSHDDPRGFEVKLNASEELAVKERRENDHG